MRHALVFGASGQIGTPLLRLLEQGGWRVTAVSRGERHDEPGLHWLRGDLDEPPPLPRAVDLVFSCGPLDLFSHWYAKADIEAARVVAFGSTSGAVKADSGDEAERDLAARLRRGEARVLDAARERGADAVLLRPTLVYGAGRDHTLTRLATLAARWGRLVLPRNATGLRQPVHVADLAAAAFAAAGASAPKDAYDLPGGETLSYREMVARVLATLQPPPALHTVPAPLFAALLKLARARGLATGLGDAAVARMRHDLVFDDAPARRDLGYQPRPFRPTPGMFVPR